MKNLRAASVLLLVFCFAAVAAAQLRKREPLTPVEIDQLRDTAMDPYGRLKLYVRFARARLASLEQTRNDAKATDRSATIHDQLQQFVDIYDELNENIDNFADRKEDMRRPLKAVIDADNEFRSKLTALKNATVDPKEAEQYRFLLETAVEAVETGAEDHRQQLAEAEEAAKHRTKRN